MHERGEGFEPNGLLRIAGRPSIILEVVGEIPPGEADVRREKGRGSASARGRTVAGLLAVACAAALTAGGTEAPGALAAPAASGIGVPVTRPCAHVAGALCGSIQVPLYWSDPGRGAPITVRFRIYEHTDTSEPALEPLVAFEGGPGYGSIGSADYYIFLLGSLHQRHDLIVMDQRGTGTSGALDCPRLQRGIGNFVRASGLCAQRLGDAAGAYGSAAVGGDMHAILSGLGIGTVDVYGDSYGTYAAQVFTIHHSGDVRALVLDGAYDNSFDPFEREESVSMRHAWRAVCAREDECPGILRSIATLSAHLATHPLNGTIPEGSGKPVRVHLTATDLAQLVGDATYYYTVFRDLPAAIAAFDHGYRQPLLRLAAEHEAGDGSNGTAAEYSMGDQDAVSCHDYPSIWNVHAGDAERRRQLDAAIAALSPRAFAPFPNEIWLHSQYQYQLVYGCLRWPAPTVSDPPFPRSLPHPNTPVLVLNGEFDQATPIADAEAVAAAWPHSTLVEVPNTAHITALDDFQDCAAAIAQRFLQTLSAGDTSCVQGMPANFVVPVFPERLASAPEASSAGPGDRSTPADRRIAWVAGATVGDALARWYSILLGPHGVGLRGGGFVARGAYFSWGPLHLRLHADRFVPDAATSGEVTWTRSAYRVDARLAVTGPNGLSGTVRISFPTNADHAVATISGEVGGHRLDLTMPAPWAPLG
jgi:pimeloyl-ACP methyl ester carboxylesterase